MLRRALIVSLLALLARGAPAEPAISMAALRAAFLYTFAKFTEWPADPAGGPFTMCVMGDLAVTEALAQAVAGRTVSGRDITVFEVTTSGGALKACHVLYVAGDAAQASRVLGDVAGAPVLTIGEGDAFVRQGGMAGLFVENGKMRFAVNPDTALRAGVRVSSKLLGLARLVKDGAHGQS